jgi:hypothetical protein
VKSKKTISWPDLGTVFDSCYVLDYLSKGLRPNFIKIEEKVFYKRATAWQMTAEMAEQKKTYPDPNRTLDEETGNKLHQQQKTSGA